MFSSVVDQRVLGLLMALAVAAGCSTLESLDGRGDTGSPDAVGDTMGSDVDPVDTAQQDTGSTDTEPTADTTSDATDIVDDAVDAVDTVQPPQKVVLTVVVTGPGSVGSDQGGLDCPGVCSITVDAGTRLTLTPTPDDATAADAGGRFAGWLATEDCGSALTNACTLTVDADVTLAAPFVLQRHLTLNVDGEGDGTIDVGSSGSCTSLSSPCTLTVDEGVSLSMTAAPDGSSLFGRWTTPASCGAAATCQVVISGGNGTVSATFDAAFPLSVTLSGAGTGRVRSTSVSVGSESLDCTADCSVLFRKGATVVVEALPDGGAGAIAPSEFDGWSGHCTGPGSCSVLLDAPRAVVADFAARWGVHVTVAGPGRVVSGPAGIDCTSGVCSATFDAGSQVTLTPTADAAVSTDPGARFDGWDAVGDCASAGMGACSLAIGGVRVATATFVKLWSLTMRVGGAGGGVLTADSGATCSSECAQTSDDGTSFVLTATPDSNSLFAGWASPSTCGANPQCSVTLSGSNVLAQADFDRAWPLSVELLGAGTGSVQTTTVTVGSESLDCQTGTCQALFRDGALVTLMAQPGAATADGWMRFEGWSGACSGTAPTCAVTMDDAVTVGATFVPMRDITVAVTGSGTVVSTPTGIACPGSCTASFIDGTDITLTAAGDPGSGNDPGSRFDAWDSSGPCGGTTGPSCDLTADADLTVGATFIKRWNLDLTLSGVGGGDIDVVDGGGTLLATCAYPGPCRLTVDEGTLLTLTALPDASSLFGGWDSACAMPTVMTCDLTITGASVGVDASFEAAHALVVTFEGSGTGTVASTSVSDGPETLSCTSDCAVLFRDGAQVELEAAPDPGARFRGWVDTTCQSFGTGRCLVDVIGTTEVNPRIDGGGSLWLQTFDRNLTQGSEDLGWSLVDGDGVVMGGHFGGRVNITGVDTNDVLSHGGRDGFIARIGLDGTPQWARALGGNADDTLVQGVAVGPNILLSLWYYSSNFDPIGTGNLPVLGGREVVFLLVDAATGAPVQVLKNITGLGSEGGRAVIDSQGNLVAVLTTNSADLDLGGACGVLSGPTTAHAIVLAQFDGTTGTCKWAHRLAGAGMDLTWEIPALNVHGTDIFVSGRYRGSVDMTPAPGGAIACAASSVNATYECGYVARYDVDGTFQWIVDVDDASGRLNQMSATLDNAGDVLLGVAFYQAVTIGSTRLQALAVDGAVFKLDGVDGQVTWAHQFVGSNPGQIQTVAVGTGPSGAVAATGFFHGTTDFGGTVETGPLWVDTAYVVALDPDGGYRWSRTFERNSAASTAWVRGTSVRVVADGRVLATGYAGTSTELLAVDFEVGAPLQVGLWESDAFAVMLGP